MPDINLINQLLKLSETDKEGAIKQLTNLHQPLTIQDDNMNDKNIDWFGPKYCRYIEEDYLSHPYLVYDPKNSNELITREA